MVAEIPQMHNSRQRRPHRPILDASSAEILEAAIHQLSGARSPLHKGNVGLRLHVLASLLAQADELIADAVTDARHDGLGWPEIGAELGLSATAANHRFADDARPSRKRPPLEVD